MKINLIIKIDAQIYICDVLITGEFLLLNISEKYDLKIGVSPIKYVMDVYKVFIFY